MYGLDDEQFKFLLGELMPEQTAVTPQAAQLTQGLLGSADGQSNNQDQKLRGLISSGLNAAAQMGQNAMAQAPDSSLEQRQAASQQAVQQAAARQQQQQQAMGSLLGAIASMFIPGGGGLLGLIKGKTGLPGGVGGLLSLFKR